MSYPPPPGPNDPNQPPYGGDPAAQQPGGPPPGYGYPPPGGQPPYQPAYQQPVGQQTAGKATTSLILGIVSLVLCGLFAGLPAIFLGFSARKEIRESNGRLGGDGLALGGIVTGILGTLWSLVLVGMLIFGVALFGSAVDQACDDLRNDGIAGNECTIE